MCYSWLRHWQWQAQLLQETHACHPDPCRNPKHGTSRVLCLDPVACLGRETFMSWHCLRINMFCRPRACPGCSPAWLKVSDRPDSPTAFRVVSALRPWLDAQGFLISLFPQSLKALRCKSRDPANPPSGCKQVLTGTPHNQGQTSPLSCSEGPVSL